MLTLLQVPTAAPQTPGAPASASPVIGVAAQNPNMDVATLQSQLGELRIQLSGLQAQWEGLQSQLNAMLKNNPARPGVQQTWADVGVQIAQIKGEIAYREARIAQKQGAPVGTTTSPSGSPFGSINQNVAFPAAALMLLVLGLPVSIAWARRILRSKPQPARLPPDHTMRLESIESAIDAVAIEVERIAEGQRFVTRILAERPDRVGAAESSGVPLSASAPPKALGAGPIEPISVQQRERVRQVVTPH